MFYLGGDDVDKRYQVFVSSTYADLKDERQKVIQTLMEMDCIPAGMELFPASDEEQFEFIKRIIDDCDYYLLIIGGRYGSIAPEGISYTEKEYDYAVSKGIKVIALIHGKPEEIPVSKSESLPELRAQLSDFRTKAMTGRLVKFWQTAEELPGQVSLSLQKTIKTYPAIGWIRADKASSEDLLADINNLRKENAKLRELLAQATPEHKPLTGLAGLEEDFEVNGTVFVQSQRRTWKRTLTWNRIFFLISPFLLKPVAEEYVKGQLEESIALEKSIGGIAAKIDEQSFKTIAMQLKALGLVNMKYTAATDKSMRMFWTLTPGGNNLMMQLRTIKTKIQDSDG